MGLYKLISTDDLQDYGLSSEEANKIISWIVDMMPDNTELNKEFYEKGDISYVLCNTIPLYYYGGIVRINMILKVLECAPNDFIDSLVVFQRIIRDGKFLDTIIIGCYFGFIEFISYLIRDPSNSQFLHATKDYEKFTYDYIKSNYYSESEDYPNIDKLAKDLKFGYYDKNRFVKYNKTIGRLFTHVFSTKNYETVEDLEENDEIVISI